MINYVCSVCGAAAGYDGRCGDDPYLLCKCDKKGSKFVADRCGGYYTNPSGAHPIEGEEAEWDNTYDLEKR